MIKNYVFLAALLISSNILFMASIMKSHAQTSISLDVPRVVPISPTAAAMEKYQSYPVDHSTGVPSITIPLYEIVAGEVSIPVNLSYHASGLKPKEASTPAGTGWTLNLEPSVSRQVCGLADDEYPYGWLNNPASGYNPATAGEAAKIKYYNELVDNERDTQPDKFSYKLPNGGGSGYFIDGINFLSIPRNNDKVEYHNASGISITDTRGMKYLFDGEQEIVENNVMRWMCKSIWSPNNPNNALINFSYTKIANVFSQGHYYNLDNKVVVNYSKNGNTIKNTFTVQTNNQNVHYSINYPSGMTNGTPDAQLTPISATQAGVNYPTINRYIPDNMTVTRLHEVNFLGNKMYVSYKSVGIVPNNSDVLDDIEVKDQTGIVVRSIKFYITPYNSNTALTKLDSVVISAPGVEPKKYSFNYNNPWNVPSIYTVAVDHWGFCNGSISQSGSTVPSFKKGIILPDVNGGISKALILNFAGAYREPDHEWTKSGVLTKVTDPQGITTTFAYEGNFAAFRDNSRSHDKDYLYPVGGLRVKRIETLDPQTRKGFYKNYTYGLTRPEVANFVPVWGGGAINHIVTIRDYVSSVTHYDDDNNTVSHILTYGSMPESDISFNGGSAVMYNMVTEEITNSTDNITMKSNYCYNVKTHNFEDILHWDDADPAGSIQTFLREQPETVLQQIARVLPDHPHRPNDDYVKHYAFTNQLYGALIRTDRFRNNKLASRTDYTYKTVRVWGTNIAVDVPHRLITGNTEGLTVNDVFLTGNYLFPENSGEVQTTYYLDTEMYRALDKETESTYYAVDGREDVVTTQKTYNYQFDMTNPGSSLKPRQIQTTNSDHTVILDSMDYLLGYPAILSRYKHMENNSWKESRILFKANSSLAEKVQSRTDQTSIFRDEVKYNAYDSYGNATEIMGKDGIPISFIWGYQAQFPVAKIENATIQQVYNGTNVFEGWAAYAEPPVALWSRIEQLRTELPNARITKFEYKPLQGVVSMTDPNNLTTKFDYDRYGRLTDSYFLDVKSPSDIRKAMLQKYIYQLGK
ncbi:YD repeat-containing protein [bacterium A37T11]|nr:YD repeat-containing protein [bacterium A37T11]